MGGNRIYVANEPNVTSEEIDNEIIIVNLLTGSYYSTTDIGAYVWKRIIAGQSPSSIVESLADSFSIHADAIEPEIGEFVEALADQDLIRVIDGKANDHGKDQGTTPPVPDAYSEPVLNCYTDMKDLLLLDPIHDVEDVGWPNAKTPTMA